MSYTRIKRVQVIPNQPRDFHFEHEAAVAFAIDLLQEHGVCGLDWALFNLGAASITIAVDNGTPITVPAGGFRGFDNIKYATLKITAAVNYTLIIAGVSI